MSTAGQLARFAVAGAIGFVVDAGVLYLASALGAGWYVGRAISFLCAVLVTWQFNRRYTFPGAAPRPSWAEWWKYLAAMALGGAVNLGAYAATLALAPASVWTPLLGVAIGSVAGMLVNFTTSKAWVFKPR